MGHSITIEAWSTVVGLGDTDSHRALCKAVGVDLGSGRVRRPLPATRPILEGRHRAPARGDRAARCPDPGRDCGGGGVELVGRLGGRPPATDGSGPPLRSVRATSDRLAGRPSPPPTPTCWLAGISAWTHVARWRWRIRPTA